MKLIRDKLEAGGCARESWWEAGLLHSAPQWEDGAGSSGRICCSKTFYKHPKLCNSYSVIHGREQRLWGKYSLAIGKFSYGTFGENECTLTFSATGKNLKGLKYI